MPFTLSHLRLAAILCCLAPAAVGCQSSRFEVRDPEYDELLSGMDQAWDDPDPVAAAIDPVVDQLAGPQPVEAYIPFALAQNPDIQAARKLVEAAANHVPQAASLQDPTLGMTLFPEQVQTAAGSQELLMTASQRFPWFGKLRTKAEAAEAGAEVARAHLAAVELAVIDEVKRTYYELYFVERAIEITKTNRDLLLQLSEITVVKLQSGTGTAQDALRAQLEVLDVDNQLIRLRQQLASQQAGLARLLHVSPQTPLAATGRLSAEQLPFDLDRLYRQAIAARPELHAQLAVIERDRSTVELAVLDYLPDVTLGMTWIDVASAGVSPVANGRDAFLVGLNVNLPIYRKRLDAAVRQAEAQAVSSARQYDSLRDATLQQVKDLFVQARSQQDLVRLFRGDIIPTADQTLRISRDAYAVGDVDFLQLIDNWQQVLRFEIALERIEAQLRQTLARLERVVGGDLQASLNQEPPQ